MKTSTTKEELYTYRGAESDRNLADHGHERKYLYSVGDGYRLLLDIREKHLNTGNPFLAATNEKNSAFRENSKKIFLSDPYHTNSFNEYFEDDITRIMGGKGNQSSWQKMPETIIIPIIDGVHWRLIRIKISYANRNADILWDDPFGKNFCEDLRTSLRTSINDKIAKLIKKQCAQLENTSDFIGEDYFKLVDQQGGPSNFYDCGPIVFSNVRDYIRNQKLENRVFSFNNDNYYTIKVYYNWSHEQILQRIREQDKKMFATTLGLIDLERVTALNTKISTNFETYKHAFIEVQIDKISKLPDIYISLLHEIIERNRSASDDITDLGCYTESELEEAYKNLQEEIRTEYERTAIEKIEKAYENFRELQRYQLDPESDSLASAVYKLANLFTMDGPGLQMDMKRNLEKIGRDIHLYKVYTDSFLRLGIRLLHDSYIFAEVKCKIIELLGLFGRFLPATEKEIVVQHLKSFLRFRDRVRNSQILETAVKSFLKTITCNYELNTLKILLKQYFLPLFKDQNFSMGVLYIKDQQKELIFKILFELIESLEDKNALTLFFLKELSNPNWEIKWAISSIFSAPFEHGILLKKFELQDIFSILNDLQSALKTDIVDEYYTQRTIRNIFEATSYIFYLFDDNNNIREKILGDQFDLLEKTNIYFIFLESTKFFIPYSYRLSPQFLQDKTPLREIIGEDGIIKLLQILLSRFKGIAFENTTTAEDLIDLAGSLLTLFADYENHALLNWGNYHEYNNLQRNAETHGSFSEVRLKFEAEEDLEKDLKQLVQKIFEVSTQEDAERIFKRVLKSIHNSDLQNKITNGTTFYIRIYKDSEFGRLKYMAMEQLTNIVTLLYENTSVLTTEIISTLSEIEERSEYREIVEQIIDFLKYGVIENPTVIEPLKSLSKEKLADVIARNHQVEAGIGDNIEILNALEVNVRDKSCSYLAYFSRAKFLIDTNQNIELALQDLNKAQSIHDFYAPIYFYKALYYEKKRDISGAIYQLEMAISLRPFYIEAYNKKITLHYEEDDWVMARITCKEIVSLYPGYTYITQSYIRSLTKNIDITDVPYKVEFDQVYQRLAQFSEVELQNVNSLKTLLKGLEKFVPIDILDFCVERYQPSHAEQLNDYLYEKRRFLEDFIQYVVMNTVSVEYSQHYLVFQNEEDRAANLNKLFEESKIHKLFNEENPSKLINELRQYCEVCTTFELLKKYSVLDQLRDGYALGISDDLARTYDIFPKLFGLHRWEAAYGNFWIYDSEGHTAQFFTELLKTEKKIVFFVPSEIGDAEYGVTRDEVLWVATKLKDNPAALKNIILVFDAYNYLPFYTLTRYYPTTAPEVDVDLSLFSIKKFILDSVLPFEQHAQFISSFEVNIGGFAERNLVGELYYEVIRVADYSSAKHKYKDQNLKRLIKEYLDGIKVALDKSIKEKKIQLFYDSLTQELLEPNKTNKIETIITTIFVFNILADPEYTQLINQKDQFSEPQQVLASRVISLLQENGSNLTPHQVNVVFDTMFDLLQRDSTAFPKDTIVATITSFLKSVTKKIDTKIEEFGDYLSKQEIRDIYQNLCNDTSKVQEHLETLERAYSFLKEQSDTEASI